MKPKALQPGDTIGIAASSSPFDKGQFLKGVKNLEAMGFRVVYQKNIFTQKSYLAGSDSRRAGELIKLLQDPTIKAIFFARGGYGMMRLMPALAKIKPQSKIILGYSDITSLLLMIGQNWKMPVFYGPVVAKDLSANLSATKKRYLLKAITQNTPLGQYRLARTKALRKGKATGKLTGGCLSLVVASLGTPFEINTQNKILFLEDTNEQPYAVDRMLTQLKLAGKFNKVKGVVFGSFDKGGALSHYQEVIHDLLAEYKIPILFNFPSGHGNDQITLPFGVKVELNTGQKSLTFLERALA